MTLERAEIQEGKKHESGFWELMHDYLDQHNKNEKDKLIVKMESTARSVAELEALDRLLEPSPLKKRVQFRITQAQEFGESASQ